MCVTVLVMTFRAIELPVDNYKGFRRHQATNMTVWWRKRDTKGLFVRRGEAKIIGMEKWRGQESRVTDEEAIVWERSLYCHCSETCRCVCSKHEVQPRHCNQSVVYCCVFSGPWPEAWCFCPFVPASARRRLQGTSLKFVTGFHSDSRMSWLTVHTLTMTEFNTDVKQDWNDEAMTLRPKVSFTSDVLHITSITHFVTEVHFPLIVQHREEKKCLLL